MPLIDDDEMTELVDADFPRVDLVGKGANGIPRFLIAKQDADSHGLIPPDMVRELIGKQAEPDPEAEDIVTVKGTPAAIAKLIHGAPVRPAGTSPEEAAMADQVAKDMGAELDEDAASPEGMDLTVPLAAPDGDAPGNPAEPGSPAWEAIDAATARKWTSIGVRLKNALGIMADREFLEAAGIDPDDADNGFDLEDAQCAMDFVIGTLAGFAVSEQAEADLSGEDMLAAVGKSAGAGPAQLAAIAKAMSSFDTGPLDTIEGFAAIAKAGRVLSTANETHIREAAARLTTVLSSLPQAPSADDGQPVAKKEATVADTQTPDAAAVAKADADAQAANTGPVNTGGTTGLGEARQTGAADALPADGPQSALPGDAPGRQVIKAAAVGLFDHARRFLGLADPDAILSDIAKAEGGKDPMMVVYNQAGKLVGIVKPDDITPVANSEAEPDEAPEDTDAAPDPADMTPAPAAETGTPATAVNPDGTVVAKASQDQEPDVFSVLKSTVKEAVAELLGTQGPAEGIAKQADVAGLRTLLEQMGTRLETVEKQDARPGVFANGAVPPPGSVPPPQPSLRGQDQGAPAVDVAKAAELRETLHNGSAPEQARAFTDLTGMAVARLAQIRANPRSPAVAE